MPAIQFEHVSKRFTLHHERARSFQDLLIQRFRRSSTSEEFWALRDVTFTVEPGTSLGIVGTNGSGKSTLLKLVTRILRPTEGSVTVHGRVSALLELGAGFHPDLSGRDNVFLNASILGMPRRRVQERFDQIVQFAGLERFIDTPVRNYSSGMYARLGFAVAIHVDPDVLLVDEVLSVGDEGFQDRCLEAIADFHRKGKTLVLVSHDVASVRNVCTEAIWLDHGAIRAQGHPGTIVDDYVAAAHATAGVAVGGGPDSTSVNDTKLSDVEHRWGSHEAEIVGVRFVDADGTERSRFRAGEAFTVRVQYRARESILKPVFGLAITTGNGTLVTGPNTRFAQLPIDAIDGEGTVTYTVDELPLIPGEYDVSASIYDLTCTHAYDFHDRQYSFTVIPGPAQERYGIVQLPARWSHHAASASSKSLDPPTRSAPIDRGMHVGTG